MKNLIYLVIVAVIIGIFLLAYTKNVSTVPEPKQTPSVEKNDKWKDLQSSPCLDESGDEIECKG